MQAAGAHSMTFTGSAKSRFFVALSLAAFLAASTGCGSGIHSAGEATSGTALTAPRGPQLGYFWNAADQTLRPVLGIAGASQVGASVVSAGAYRNGAGSAGNGIGVLEQQDGSLDIIALPSGAPSHFAASAPDHSNIRFSPNGKAAIVYAAGQSGIIVLTALDTTPVAASLATTASLSDAAVSDTGRVVVATSSAAGMSLQSISASGTARTLAQAGALGGFSFGNGDDLYFADAATNQLYFIHNESAAATVAQISTSSLLRTPAALAVSAGGQWLVAINSAESSVVRIDLTGQNAPLLLTCACTPTTAAALSGAGRFRITEPGTGPLWAVDSVTATPRTFFIPALPVVKK